LKTTLITGLAVVNELGDVIGDSILVENGLIKGIGPKSRFTGSYGVEYRFDGYILPPIIDAHLHVKSLGLNAIGIDLRGVQSIVELKEVLKSSKAPLIYGRGWDQELLRESRWPTRWDLDDVVRDRPVVLVRICGHAAVLNSRALELTRPWELYPNYTLMESGAPTGIVFEDAVIYVLNKLLEVTDIRGLVLKALEWLSRSGIAGASSMSCSDDELKALESIALEAGALPVKISCYPDYVRRDYVKGGVKGWVEIAGFKLYSDGSLGARTAYLREPYSDEPSVRGMLLADRRAIGAAMVEASRRGLKLAVHAIGDGALDEVLEAAKATEARRFRVEHASIAWDDQIDLLRDLSAYVVVQPRFRVSDWWVDKRLGSRVKIVYRFKSMVSRGVKIALSSDAPVEPFDPNETIRAAMSICGQPACFKEEALDMKEILLAYTKVAAEASGGALSNSGVLEKGYNADLTVSRLNPLWDNAIEPLEVVVSGFRATHVFKYLP
jgi:predicted amidohydrolase YtcJ